MQNRCVSFALLEQRALWLFPSKSRYKLSFVGEWFTSKYTIFCLASKLSHGSRAHPHIYSSTFFFPSHAASQPASQSYHIWNACEKCVCAMNATVCSCSVSPSKRVASVFICSFSIYTFSSIEHTASISFSMLIPYVRAWPSIIQ